MRTPPRVEPPRLWRSVLLQLLAIGVGAMASELPLRHRSAVPEPPPPRKEERRIRVVRIEKPPPPPPSPPLPQAKAAPPPVAIRPAPPPQAKPLARAPQRIAADSTAVHGVRLRVLVPRSAADLSAHLRNSGGCLVVSRLVGGEAEVVQTIGSDGPPCNGVPRLLRDASLNDALGDPLGRARASHPADQLVLQVLLSDRLHDSARAALRARFGDVSDEEMGRRAAESGYELTCFAESLGTIRCQ